jgi:hypothetical protein
VSNSSDSELSASATSCVAGWYFRTKALNSAVTTIP